MNRVIVMSAISAARKSYEIVVVYPGTREEYRRVNDATRTVTKIRPRVPSFKQRSQAFGRRSVDVRSGWYPVNDEFGCRVVYKEYGRTMIKS